MCFLYIHNPWLHDKTVTGVDSLYVSLELSNRTYYITYYPILDEEFHCSSMRMIPNQVLSHFGSLVFIATLRMEKWCVPLGWCHQQRLQTPPWSFARMKRRTIHGSISMAAPSSMPSLSWSSTRNQTPQWCSSGLAIRSMRFWFANTCHLFSTIPIIVFVCYANGANRHII